MKRYLNIYLVILSLLILTERFNQTETHENNDITSGFVCANSYNAVERHEEHVRCVTIDGMTTVNLECNLFKSFKLENKLRADVIKSRLTISPARLDLD